MVELTRREVWLGLAAAVGLGAGATVLGQRIWSQVAGPMPPFGEVVEDVTPAQGFATGVGFGEAIVRMIDAGVLDPDKLRSVFGARGGLPGWVDRLLSGPSSEPIVLSSETAPYLLTLLWPVGLATRASYNERSPINNGRLADYASTGGWRLGIEANGAHYFNRVATFAMTADQERRALEVAQSTYRPCCDNSTFLQDCNHGSALLGLIELAASQGLPKRDIFRIALVANSFWFRREYLKTALYLAIHEKRSWRETPPEEILGARLSSWSGWGRNVNMTLQLTSFIPRSILLQMDQSDCRL